MWLPTSSDNDDDMHARPNAVLGTQRHLVYKPDHVCRRDHRAYLRTDLHLQPVPTIIDHGQRKERRRVGCTVDKPLSRLVLGSRYRGLGCVRGGGLDVHTMHTRQQLQQ